MNGDFNLMHDEWNAWQDLVKEFKAVFPKEDFNDPKFGPFVNAIESWGKRLVILRKYQLDNNLILDVDGAPVNK